MAKPDVSQADPTVISRAVLELKKELQRLVKAIVDDDDCSLQTIDQAQQKLSAMKDLKVKKSLSLKIDATLAAPEEFLCPLSKEVMRDPVILASGQTYDRPFIDNWLKAGNRTCPRTEQVLSHTVLTPNHLIREVISKWCTNQGIELANTIEYIHEGAATGADRAHFLFLLKKMSLPLPHQKEAAKELRVLTKKVPSFRTIFGESHDFIPQLLGPLSKTESLSEVPSDLQEDLITTLLNLSIHDNNKKLVAETPIVIPVLIDALQSGTMETRSNSAAAIFTLSALDSNKLLIGKSGALKPLIDLLDKGHQLAMKDAASAIFNLCIAHENKSRAVKAGAVKVIMKKIMDRTLVDELLSTLAMLSCHQRAVEELVQLKAIPCLLTIIRESNTCARSKENCIAIIHNLCYNDRTTWKELREEEKAFGTISQLTSNGTSRAKRKANELLERLNKAVNFTHTA